MIFDQILFHNVEELEETEKGYLLRRVCKKVRDGISDGVQNNRFATGVELRFRMTDGAVDLTLSSELVAESATVHIFFGSFQGGGEYSSKNVGPGNTTIHIEYPTGMEKLRQLAEEYHLPYDGGGAGGDALYSVLLRRSEGESGAAPQRRPAGEDVSGVWFVDHTWKSRIDPAGFLCIPDRTAAGDRLSESGICRVCVDGRGDGGISHIP